MESFTLDNLPDETMIHVIGHLTLWDAFALEATNKRMRELVRAHQKVQKWLDVTFPSQLSRSQLQAHQGMKKTILTRFGPKLLNIKGIDEGFSFKRRLKNDKFIKELAVACPNLIEIPSYRIPDLSTYTSNRLVALKKIVMKTGYSTAAKVKRLLMNSPQLEDLTIYADSPSTQDGSLLKAVEAGVLEDNRIRKLDLHFMQVYDVSLYQVVERLITKLPHLAHLNFNGVDEEQFAPLEKLLAVTNFSKSIELSNCALPALPTTIAMHVTSANLFHTDNQDVSTLLKRFTNLKRVQMKLASAPNYSSSTVLVLPQTVSELSVCDIAQLGEVDYIDGFIKNQGKQLESITLIYRHQKMTAPDDPTWTRQLIVSITKSTVALKSLTMKKFASDFDSQCSRDFFKTRGKSLEHFHVKQQILSLCTLRLISVKCKSLKSLKCGFAIGKKKEENAQIDQMEKLLKGMANLFEAELTIRKYFGERGWQSVAKCAYANGKFLFRRNPSNSFFQ